MQSKLGAALLLSFSSPALAAPIEWPVASGGNGHFYERVDQTNLTFSDALAAAAARTHNGVPGHLLILESVRYNDELSFVFDQVYTPGVVWSRVYWIGATLGTETGASWQWINGASVPESGTWWVDHAEGPGAEGAGFYAPSFHYIGDYIMTNSSGLISGYIVEFEAASCPADLNGDGFVDDADFVLFVSAYNILDCADPSMSVGCPSDFNSDGLVDDADFVIFVGAYNELVCP